MTLPDGLLRAALRTAARHSTDHAFRALVDDVLAGRTTLRDAARQPAFGRVVGSAARAGVAEWAALPAEERRRRVAAAETAIEEMQRGQPG
jgi:hypothetical protein